LSSKWFYDDVGSELFEKIMSVDSYYPTECETEIFHTHGKKLMEALAPGPMRLVDLGAGDGSKTDILLKALMEVNDDVEYAPIDISEGAMKTLSKRVKRDFSDLKLGGCVGDYLSALQWMNQNRGDRAHAVLFLGSNIGNFTPEQAIHFLASLRSTLESGDAVLVGFDLKKDINVIQKAYHDDEGMTSAFNLNLLTRINRELKANFDVNHFVHHSYYNPISGAAESYLVSTREQDVELKALDLVVHFEEYEAIHTEYSHKYLHKDICEYAERSGFVVDQVVCDQRGWFADALYKVR